METKWFKVITAWLLSRLLFLLLMTWPCLRVIAKEECKNIIWLPEKSGSYLRNHTIQNMTVSSQSMCRIMCYLSDYSCLSYNFHQSTSTCEINESDEFQHPDDLIPMHGYTYTGTKNGCQSKPCSGNAACQANLAHEGEFKCLCPSGFTGARCETDIDECTSVHSSCPTNSTCFNKVGSYECRCNAGYKKSGQECLPSRGTKDLPGESCLSILNTGDSQGTGEYWLDPRDTGNPIKAFCDMTTDGGGWTTLKRLYLHTPAIPVSNILNSFDTAISGGLNITENSVPTGQAMLDIHTTMGFHQIHFYCYKKSVGRVVSIMTKNNTAGQKVVSYFTTAEEATAFPAACDSFDRLPEDNSFLAQNCALWGKDKRGKTAVKKWGSSEFRWGKRIATCPFAIMGGAEEYGFRCSNHSKHVYSSCDDGWTNPSPLNVNDTWQIAVR